MVAGVFTMVCAGLSAPVFGAGAQPAATTPKPPTAAVRAARAAAGKTFDSPALAADALIDAADRFDTAALEDLFGPAG